MYIGTRQEANLALMFGCDNQPRKVAMGYVVADGVICRTGAISLYIEASIYLGESGIHQQGAGRESHDDHVALQPLLAKDDDERGEVRGEKEKVALETPQPSSSSW